jgi:hypothetical protein
MSRTLGIAIVVWPIASGALLLLREAGRRALNHHRNRKTTP